MTDIPKLLSDKMASGEITTLIAEILELNPLVTTCITWRTAT
jgi:hypothetical protein